MEKLDFKLTEPRRKKCRSRPVKGLVVPTKHESNNDDIQEMKICLGHLRDKSVFVNDLDEIEHLYVNGFFGKGLFSKGAPKTLQYFCADEHGFLRSGPNKKHVEPNSNSEVPDLEHEPLVLSLCEAFYLSHHFGVLVVESENGEAMSLKKMWTRFQELDDGFVTQYASYCYFRNKGWVVRSGAKYGTDFVLYKDGPAFYHSSYSVVVCPIVSDGEGEGLARSTLPSDWTEMSCLVRVTEQVAKELLACIVVIPRTSKETFHDNPSCINCFQIFEIIIKRWVSKKEREDPDEGGH